LPRLILEIDIGQRLSVVVADDETGIVVFLDRPRWREAADSSQFLRSHQQEVTVFDLYKTIGRSHLASICPDGYLSGVGGRPAMERWESDFSGGVDEPDVPDSPEQRVDRFGVMIAVFALAIAFSIAAIWFLSRPSFEKCSALENVQERNACYDTLRSDLSKAPAKGPDIPSVKGGAYR
jgi:hypothetical protein